MSAPTTPPRRRWLRYSLRTLLLVVTAVCLVMGLWVRGALEQKRAVAVILAQDGEVKYSNEVLNSNLDDRSRAPVESWAPGWLIDWLGRDFFCRVDWVGLPDANDAALHATGQLRHLIRLDIEDEGGEVSDEGLRHLAGLRELQELYLQAPNVTSIGIQHLSALTALRLLMLETEGVTDSGIACLGPLSELRFLQLSRCHRVTPEGLRPLGQLPRLAYLAISCTSYDDEHVRALATLPKLEELWIGSFNMTGEGLAEFSSPSGLRRLDLSNCTSVNQVPLVNSTLVRFTAENCLQLGDDGLSTLAGWQHLESLTFLGRSRIGDETLRRASEIRSLKSIHIVNANVSDEGLSHLRASTALEALSLQTCFRVTGATMDSLSALVNLKALYIEFCPLDDANLARLPHLPALTHLSINDTHVTEAGLLQLARFPKLTTLQARKCLLSDAGLKEIETWAGLKLLSIDPSQITPAADVRFQRARPDCKIVGF